MLDNMERVLRAARAVGELAAATPGLTVLVTSRARPDLTGEHCITVEPSRATGVRFEMLETLREFASERLDERGGAAGARERHLAYFAQLADEAYDAPPEGRALVRSRLDDERENLSAAYSEASGRRRPRPSAWPVRSGCSSRSVA
ncbi:MAG: hypothetical protein M5U27_13970 [Gaiella sp.]|nr:hypothetical protein [Gaiella sp.]